MRVLIAGRVASTGEAEREAKVAREDGMVVPETATAAAETAVEVREMEAAATAEAALGAAMV